MARYITFDIGGTSTKWAVVENGVLSARPEFPSPSQEGGEAIFEALLLRLQEERFDGIAISTAGQVNVEEGSILYANENIPHYTGFPWRKRLEALFQVPVYVENDVNAAALGEHVYGQAKADNFLCLTYGTGVGGAIFINGQLYRGAGFVAGEMGALPISLENRVKGQYFRGCYEEVASASALVRRAASLNPAWASGRALLAAKEDPRLQAVIEDWLQAVLFGLAGLIHLFNPELLVLGGGIMENAWLFAQLEQKLPEYVMPSFRHYRLQAASLGNQAGLYGALAGLEKYIKERKQV